MRPHPGAFCRTHPRPDGLKTTPQPFFTADFFAKLTRQRLKRGVFKGIVDLQAAINRYLAETNDNPKPFTWTADPDAIIEKVRRGKQALESIH